MVAVIAGAGLGVVNSNLNTGAGTSGNAELGQARELVYVNAATGNLVLQNADERVSGLGPGFSLVRTYNSLANVDGDNNDQWRLGFISSVSRINSTQYQRVNADGFIQSFNFDASTGKYYSAEAGGHKDVLDIKLNGEITIQSDGQLVETYATDGRLLSKSNPNGVLTIIYSAGRPAKITQQLGDGRIDETLLDYVTSPLGQPLLQRVRTSSDNGNQSLVEYRYDNADRLQFVLIDKTPETKADNSALMSQDNSSYVIEYGYKDASSRQITSVRQYDVRASGAIDKVVDLAINYYADNDVAYKRGRVATVTQGGITTTYNYNWTLRTTVTTGKEVVEYDFNADSTLKAVFYPGTNTKTLFDYYPNGLLKQITQPEGLVTFYEYDGNGNRTKLSVTGMPDIISQYDIYNNLVLERQGDNVKRNIYQIAGGKSLLRYAIDGEGGVTEYRYNHLNQLTEKLVLLKHKVDISVVAPDAPVPIALVEQLITAAGSEIELTELRYDFRGNLKSESRYSAFNAQTKKGSGAVSVWSYLYDFRGQLLQAVKPQGTASAALNDHTITYSYDGLGRLLSKNDSEAQSVSYRFDDQERSFEVVYQNGRVERSVYDSAGLVVRRQVADGALLMAELRVVYDNTGRQIASQNEYGQWQYNFYDKTGTLAATVGATGEVVRYFYDNALRVTRRIEYAKTLSSVQNWLQNDQQTITLAALDSQISALADADARHYHLFYNGVNKQYEVDGTQYVTEFVYDTAGLLSEKRIYKNPATSDNINKKMLGFDRSAEVAAIETYGYDKAGRLKNLTDGAGYRTEFDYDGSGRKIAERAYANKAVNGEFKESDADRVQLWWYDNRGFQIAHLSADGALTHFEYNANGQQSLLKQAANRVNKWDRNNGIPPLQGGLRVTQYRYDTAGRLKSEVSPEGLATVLVYNSDGQVAEKWQGQQRQPAAVGPDDLVIIDTTYEFVLERYSYDIHGNRTAVLDARENRELGLTVTADKVRQAMLTAPSLRHIYDLAGNLIESRDAEGGQTLYYYDANQRLSLLIDAEGLLTSYEYNGRGEVVRTIRADKPVSAQQITQLLNDRQGRGDLQGQAISTLLDSYFSLQNGSRISKNQQDILETNTYNKAGPHLTTVRDLNAPEAANSKVEQWSNALGLSSQQRIRQSYLSIQAGWAQTSSALTTNQHYDQRGLLNTVWRNNQRISETDYDAFGRLFSAKNALDVQTKTDYQLSSADRDNNKIGRVITSNIQVAGSDRTQIIRYDAFGRMLETQDALGVKNTYLYDDANRKLTITNSQTGVSTETSRNVLGRVTDVVVRQEGALLQHSRFVYDANGNLQETYLNGVLQESRTYSKTNQLQTLKDATQSVSQTSYDKNGRIVKTVIDVNGLALTTEWDFKSGRSELKQTQGNRVSWTGFDKNGRVKYLDQLEVMDGVSYRIRTAYSYDQAGQKIAVTTGIRFTLDAEQKPLGNEDNSVAQTNKYDYDIEGRLMRQYTMLGSSRVNEVQYLYNNADQLVEKKELLTTTLIKRTFYGYNEAGELAYEAVSHKDEANKLWLSLQTFDYDNKGRRIATHQYQQLLDSGTTGNGVVKTEDLREKVRLASGLIASSYVAYDSEDRVVARVNPEGSRSFTRYDGLGRVIEEFVSGLSKALTPDEVKQIQAGTFGHGAGIYSGSGDVRSSYVYNTQNKVAYKLSSTADGSKATVTGYQYDPEGKLTQSRHYNKQVTYLATPQMADLHTLAASQSDRVSQQFYDQADRLRYVIDASGLVTEYGYNLHGQRIAETKHNNLISSIEGLANKWQSGSLSYVELSAKYRANEAVSGSRQVQTEYDLLGRVSKITYPEQDNQGRFYTEQYQYNAAGLKTHFTDRNGKVWQYQYDAAGRLSAEFTPQLTADDKVQLKLENGNYVAVTGYGKKTYEYDGQGNLTALKEGFVSQLTDTVYYLHNTEAGAIASETRATTFDYDQAGRQIKVTQPKVENAPEVYSTTTYDAFGRAISSVLHSYGKAVSAEYKVYDMAGRVKYDIVATDSPLDNAKTPKTGYVTEYVYNSFNQQTKLIRYADKVDISAVVQNLFAAQPQRVNPVWSLSDARIIETHYDSAGRKIKVLEQERDYSYWHNGQLLSTRGQPETKFEYNSFGEVWKSSVKVNPTDWLDSYSWYDNVGRKTHQLDAAGYLSVSTYNNMGETETYTEYARALPAQVRTYDTLPALPASGDNNTGSDRSWRYVYDKLGRRISETQTGTLYYQNAGSSQALSSLNKTTSYNGTGQVLAATDSQGTTEFAYNSLGQLLQNKGLASSVISTDVRNLNVLQTLEQQSQTQRKVTQFEYDIFGNMTLTRQLSGMAGQDRITRFSYNKRDQVTEQLEVITGENGKKTKFKYDAAGRVSEQSLAFEEEQARKNVVAGYIGNVNFPDKEIDRDRDRDPVKLQAPVKNTYGWLSVDHATGVITGVAPQGISFFSLQVQIIDSSGETKQYNVRQAGSENGVVSFTKGQQVTLQIEGYSSSSTPLKRTFTTNYQYAVNGQPSKVVQSSTLFNGGATEVESSKELSYNAFGELTSQKGLNSAKASEDQYRYIYNSSGLLYRSNENGGAVSTLTYDLAGRLLQSTDALKGTTRFITDALGRQIELQQQAQTAAESPYSSYQTFDRWGNVLSLTDAAGYTYRYQYNHQNQVVAEYKPEATTVGLDGSASRNSATSYFRYNAAGQLLIKTDANGNQQRSYFDNSGQLISTIDGEGNRTYYGYDLMGRLVAQQDATGLIETTQYNQLGLATETGRIFRSSNNSVSGELFQYELKNRYEYNNAGQRISSTDALGQQQTYRYNARDQLVMSLSPALLHKEYRYDAQGIKTFESYRTYATGIQRSNRWVTNTTGQVNELIDLGDVKTSYGYELVSGLSNNGELSGPVNSQRLKFMRVEGTGDRAGTLTYDYYLNGWLKSVTHSNGNVSSYEYNKNGQRIRESHRSKDGANWVEQHVLTTYDELGRVRKVEVQNASGILLSKISYRYDAVGNRRSMTVQNGLEGTIDAISVSPAVQEAVIDVKSGAEFSSRVVALDELFVTDEASLLQLKLGPEAPEWLQLQYNPDAGTFVIVNKPGMKAPAFNNFQTFTFTVSAHELLTDTVLATKELKIRLMPERLMLSPDLALDTDVRNKQTEFYIHDNLLVRHYKAGVYDEQDPDKSHFSFVSIGLLERHVATTANRVVKNYFVDPYGGKVSINTDALRAELAAKAPFLTVSPVTEQQRLRIASALPAEMPGQVVLQSGTYDIRLEVIDSKGGKQMFTLRLVIDAVAPTAPVVPNVGAIVYLGEGQSISTQLKSAAEPNKALTYHVSKGTLPKGLTLTADGLLSGEVDKTALTGTGDHWNRQVFEVELVAQQGALTSAPTKLVFDIRNIPTAWTSMGKKLPTIKTLANRPVKVPLQEFLKAPDGNRVRLQNWPEGTSYDESTFELTIHPLAASKTFDLVISDSSNGSGHVVPVQKLTIEVVSQMPVFASDISLDQDSNTGQTSVDYQNAIITRNYKATVYDPADTDFSHYSFVSIPLLNRVRAGADSQSRLVKEYFVDPYGGQLKINRQALENEFKKPQYQLNGKPFLWLSQASDEIDRVKIESTRGIDQKGQVALKAGQFDIPIELIDSKGISHHVTLLLVIDAAPPAAPLTQFQNNLIVLGETQSVETQLLNSSSGSSGVITYSYEGNLPKGLTLTAEGKLIGTVAKDAVVGRGDHWNSQSFSVQVFANQNGLRSAASALTFNIRNTPTEWTPPKDLLLEKASWGQPWLLDLTQYLRAPDGNEVMLLGFDGEMPPGMVWDKTNKKISWLPTSDYLSKPLAFKLRIADAPAQLGGVDNINGLDGHPVKSVNVAITVQNQAPQLSPDLALDSQVVNKQTVIDVNNREITRFYKATDYHNWNTSQPKNWFSNVSIPLLNRQNSSDPTAVVKQYFVDPEGRALTIDLEHLRPQLAPYYPWLVLDESNPGSPRIHSKTATEDWSAVVLKAGTYIFTIRVKDQDQQSQDFTLKLVIEQGPPAMPVMPSKQNIFELGEGQELHRQLTSASGGSGVITYGYNGTLPKGLSLSSDGVLKGTIAADAVVANGSHWNKQTFTVDVFAIQNGQKSVASTLTFNVRNAPTPWQDKPELRSDTAVAGQPWILDLSKYLLAKDGNEVTLASFTPGLTLVKEGQKHQLVWMPTAGVTSLNYELKIFDAPNADGTNGHPPKIIAGTIKVQNQAPKLTEDLVQDTQVLNGQTVVDFNNRIITRFYKATDYHSWNTTQPKNWFSNVSIPLLNRQNSSDPTAVVKQYFVDPEGRELSIDLAHLRPQLAALSPWLVLDESDPKSPRIRSATATADWSAVVLQSGTYSFTIRVKDADGMAQDFTLKLVIDKSPPPAPVAPLHPQYPAQLNTAFNDGYFIEGKGYEFNLLQSQDNNNKITGYKIVSGALPTGLRLDPATGKIYGTIDKGFVSGTIGNNHYDWRQQDVRIVAENASGLSRELSLSFKVKNKPVEWTDTPASRPTSAIVGTRWELPLTDAYRKTTDGRRVSLVTFNSPLQYDSARNVLYYDVPANNALVGIPVNYSFVMGGAERIGNELLAKDVVVTGSILIAAKPNAVPIINPKIYQETDYQNFHTKVEGNTITRHYTTNGTEYPGSSPSNPTRYGNVSIPLIGRGDGLNQSGSIPRYVYEYFADDGGLGNLTIDVMRLAGDVKYHGKFSLELGDSSMVAAINSRYGNGIATYVSGKAANYVRLRQTQPVTQAITLNFGIKVSDAQGGTSSFNLTLKFAAPPAAKTAAAPQLRTAALAQTTGSSMFMASKMNAEQPMLDDEFDNAAFLRLYGHLYTGQETRQAPESAVLAEAEASADGTLLSADKPLALQKFAVQKLQQEPAFLAEASAAPTSAMVVSQQSAELAPPPVLQRSLTTAAAPAGSANKAPVRSYWYSYDKNNRVLVDGGNLNGVTGTIDISQQGRWIQYNQLGQQAYVVSADAVNKGRYTAQHFVYNSKNLLVAVEQAAAKLHTPETDPSKHFVGVDVHDSLSDFLQGETVKTLRQDLDWRDSQRFYYDVLDRVEETVQYANIVDVFSLVQPSEDPDDPQQPIEKQPRQQDFHDVVVDLRGVAQSRQRTLYNRDGQVSSTSTELHAKGAERLNADYVSNKVISSGLGHGAVYYRPDDLSADKLTYKSLETTYSKFNEMGVASKFSVNDLSDGKLYNYERWFEYRETVLEQKVTGSGTTTGPGRLGTSESQSSYDIHGNRLRVDEKNSENKMLQVRQMVYAADGSLLQKRDGTIENGTLHGSLTGLKVQNFAHHFSSNGQYLGEVSEQRRHDAGGNYSSSSFSSTVLEQHFSSEQAGQSSAFKHTVRRGDNLRTLAQLYYGSGDYWYLIAGANGLAASSEQGSAAQSELTEGITLDIPARASSFNNHSNFKPMDLAKIIGDTTPAVPYIPPPPKAGCNAVAMIVMIAITVVATIATAGAAAAAMGGVVSGATGMAAGTAVLSGTAIAAGGTVVGAIGATAAGMAAAAVGGFVGSAIGQVAGKALGVVDSFSLKNAFASGLTAGATAGLGNLMGVGSKVADGTFSGIASGSKVGTTATLNLAGKMTMAASAAGINVAANKLAGNNKASFQWRNVVTGAATAGAMHGMGITDTQSSWSKGFSDIGFGADVLNGFAGAAVGYGVSKGLYNEGSWNFRNVATDVFGNALGNSIVSGLSTKQTEQQAERKGNEAFEKAKAAGMTDTQASKVATDEMLSMLPPDKRRQLLVDNDGERLSINFAGKNGKVDRNQGGLSMSMAGDDFRSRHASLVDFISDEGLWGNNQMLGLATGLLDKRASYYSYDSIAKRGQQVFESAAANSQARYNHINRDRIAQQQNLRDTSSKLNKLNEIASLKYETSDPVKIVFFPYAQPNNDPAFNARMNKVLEDGHMGVGNVGTYEEFIWLARNNSERKPIRVDARPLADRLNVGTGPFINPFGESGWDGLKIHGHVGVNKENGHIFYGYYDFDIQKYNMSKPQSIPMTFIRNYLNEAAIYQHGRGINSFQIQYEYTDNDIIHGRGAGK